LEAPHRKRNTVVVAPDADRSGAFGKKRMTIADHGAAVRLSPGCGRGEQYGEYAGEKAAHRMLPPAPQYSIVAVPQSAAHFRLTRTAMTEVAEAEKLILERMLPPRPERARLEQCAGRVLLEDIAAERDQPP